MVDGDPIEEEQMTAAPLTAHDAIEHLIGRHDLTVDDVASLPEDLRYELVHGRLVLTPSPMPTHQNIGAQIWAALLINRPSFGHVSLDQSIMLDGHNQRDPDVMAFREAGNRSPVAATDVLLVVEVVSPSSRVTDREDKFKDYAYAGIPSYWIVDPSGDRVTFTQFVLEHGGSYRRVLTTDEPVTVNEPWVVDLDPPLWTQERNRLNGVSSPGR
jgi:Uma2 family endonuclease